MTRTLPVHGYDANPDRFGGLRAYGSDALAIQDLIRDDPALGAPLHPALPYLGAEVVWALRAEMARTVEDVLARRTARCSWTRAPPSRWRPPWRGSRRGSSTGAPRGSCARSRSSGSWLGGTCLE